MLLRFISLSAYIGSTQVRTKLIAAISAVTLLAPGFASAASTAVTDASVTRGNFIRSVAKAFSLPLDSDLKAQTIRAPKALLPYLGAAEKRGALAIFKSPIDHTMAITRGEAAYVLAKIGRAEAGTASVSFSDVPRTSPYYDVISAVTAKKWMKPVRPKKFGVAAKLTEREMRLILVRVKTPLQTETPFGGQMIRVNLNSKATLPRDQMLRTVWQLLSTQYLYKDRIKDDEAAFKAAEGLVQSLNDPYTVFMRPAQTKNFQTQIQGEVTGIGAQVEQKDGALIIVSPIRGSPAEKAGLLPGDEITAADGTALRGMSFEDAVNKVRGPKGSSVRLTIRRNGAEFEVTVLRDTVKVAEIEISFQGSVAVVMLRQFGNITENEFRSLMEQVQEQNPTGVILDLRNNPGGLLHAAEIVVSNFVPQGTIVASIKSTEREYFETTVDPPTILANVPLIVLVNKGSASASEIVAGALQDAKRARVVGDQTFGKGTVQQVLQFTDGSSLKMTIAEWFTPIGRKIDGVGITPDIMVELGDRDQQMLKAIELLR